MSISNELFTDHLLENYLRMYFKKKVTELKRKQFHARSNDWQRNYYNIGIRK